jgi:hypothetical protein
MSIKVRHGLIWKQQPQENMYPIIRDRLVKNNIKWKLNNTDLNKLYEEQKELFHIFHHDTDERKVRFCISCKMYYKTDYHFEDVNINLCSDKPCHPDQTKCCFRKLLDGELI